MYSNKFLIVAVVILCAAVTLTHQRRINVFEIPRKQVFDIAVLRSHTPVVAYFTKPSCSLCNRIQSNLEEVAKENNARMNLAIIDLEKYPEMKDQLQITNIPTTRAYYRGKMEGQVKGPVWNSVNKMVQNFLESKK